MIKKVRIEGNGCQAPYGIGEIITIIPVAHIRKIVKFVRQWHNPPVLRDDETSERLEIEWDYDCNNRPTTAHLVKARER